VQYWWIEINFPDRKIFTCSLEEKTHFLTERTMSEIKYMLLIESICKRKKQSGTLFFNVVFKQKSYPTRFVSNRNGQVARLSVSKESATEGC